MDEHNSFYTITLHYGVTTLQFDFIETQEQNLETLKHSLKNKSEPLQIRRSETEEDYIDLNKVLFYSIKKN